MNQIATKPTDAETALTTLDEAELATVVGGSLEEFISRCLREMPELPMPGELPGIL